MRTMTKPPPRLRRGLLDYACLCDHGVWIAARLVWCEKPARAIRRNSNRITPYSAISSERAARPPKPADAAKRPADRVS